MHYLIISVNTKLLCTFPICVHSFVSQKPGQSGQTLLSALSQVEKVTIFTQFHELLITPSKIMRGS